MDDAVVGFDVRVGDLEIIHQVRAGEDQFFACDRGEGSGSQQLSQAVLAFDDVQVADFSELVRRQRVEVDVGAGFPGVFARSEHRVRAR